MKLRPTPITVPADLARLPTHEGLRLLRKLQSRSILYVAARAGISRSYLFRLEQGELALSPGLAMRLLRVLLELPDAASETP